MSEGKKIHRPIKSEVKEKKKQERKRRRLTDPIAIRRGKTIKQNWYHFHKTSLFPCVPANFTMRHTLSTANDSLALAHSLLRAH